MYHYKEGVSKFIPLQKYNKKRVHDWFNKECEEDKEKRDLQ